MDVAAVGQADAAEPGRDQHLRGQTALPPSLFVPAEAEFGQTLPPSRVRSRPGLVEAAAVLAFIVAGFTILSYGLVGSAVVFADSYAVVTDDPYLKFAFVMSLTLCGLHIWGGVAALSGRTNKVLLSGAVLSVTLTVTDTILTVATGGGFSPVVFFKLIVPATLAICLRHRWSLAWFRAQGGSAF